MKYRLLLFDLDGTLLTTKREIGHETLTSLRRLMSQGVRVGFATGRSLKSIEPFRRILGPDGPLILFNGARIWHEGQYVFRRNLSYDVALQALHLAQRFDDLHVNLYMNDDIMISRKTPRSLESEVKDGVTHTVVGDLPRWFDHQSQVPIKIMLISEPKNLESFAKEYAPLVEGRCTLIRSETNYLEITPQGINKGAALEPLEEKCGIKASDIVAFGDNLNDLDLLKWCGLGVAMANAHDDVKAIAKRTIGHHETDAIPRFLEEIFPDAP